MSEPLSFDAQERFPVAGRRVLVTGAAHGLGLAISSALVGAGATVAMLDRDEGALEDLDPGFHRDGRASVFACDIADETGVKAVVDEAIAKFDGLDAVINAAAIYPTAEVSEAPADHLAGVLGVNVGGTANVVRAARAALVDSGRGRVVNFASITFYLGFPLGLGAYISSKGAIIGLTHALARELGPQGITVNAIAPGAFPTRAEEIIEDRAAYDETILEAQSIKRRGDVGDVAATALFLVSDAAAFITAQTLVVDGGWVPT